jgi:hypothetical protein
VFNTHRDAIEGGQSSASPCELPYLTLGLSGGGCPKRGDYRWRSSRTRAFLPTLPRR